MRPFLVINMALNNTTSAATVAPRRDRIHSPKTKFLASGLSVADPRTSGHRGTVPASRCLWMPLVTDVFVPRVLTGNLPS